MAYTPVDPILLSVFTSLPIKAAGKSSLLLLEDDLKSLKTKFIGAMLLSESDSPFDLVALMDVVQLRRLSRNLGEMANHLVQVRMDAEMEEQENRNTKRKRKR